MGGTKLLIRMLMVVSVAALLWSTNAQVYRVAQMNADQIRALDKQKTAVVLPGGVLEQHGPHLPSYSDGYMNEWLTEKLAEVIVALPGWAVLVFPTIPLGHGGANEIGGTETTGVDEEKRYRVGPLGGSEVSTTSRRIRQ
jgi:hypothetical protein